MKTITIHEVVCGSIVLEVSSIVKLTAKGKLGFNGVKGANCQLTVKTRVTDSSPTTYFFSKETREEIEKMVGHKIQPVKKPKVKKNADD